MITLKTAAQIDGLRDKLGDLEMRGVTEAALWQLPSGSICVGVPGEMEGREYGTVEVVPVGGPEG